MKKIIYGILALVVAFSAIAAVWDNSTLVYSISGGNCDEVYATFCNDGQAMQGTTTYEVYFAASGNAKNGTMVASGTVDALDAGACEELSYDPDGVLGNYIFKVYQRPGHPGTGVLWSAAINIESCSNNEIPEFTTIGATVALIGAGLYIWKKRQ
jgi:YqxM protein